MLNFLAKETDETCEETVNMKHKIHNSVHMKTNKYMFIRRDGLEPLLFDRF